MRFEDKRTEDLVPLNCSAMVFESLPRPPLCSGRQMSILVAPHHRRHTGAVVCVWVIVVLAIAFVTAISLLIGQYQYSYAKRNALCDQQEAQTHLFDFSS